ncbi:Rab1a [Spironucleus salmonicida]|uniref:Rab1a n=1 Tax=Spironucleus salmonicida TaxID=348837 RepID=V6LPH0_9EUKA|nr:Rab1a [Spironucleus salmonicida]|eukprot:EST46138.1 Rab7 family GTPase [Spironucleus salmonicida]
MPKKNLKILLLGDSSVGKTSLMNSFINTDFTALYRPTIGADFLCKELQLGKTNVKLQIWDTAGQEQWFTSMGSAYYRGADCVILIYDICSAKTLQNLDQWRNDFLQNSGIQNIQKFPFIILGNKVDLIDQQTVSEARGRSFAESRGGNFKHFQVSAKNGEGVENAFRIGAEMALEVGGDGGEVEGEDFVIEAVEENEIAKGRGKGCC